MASPGGGGTIRGGGGFYSLWDTPRPGNFLQIPGEISLGGQRQLAVVGPLPVEGTEEVGEADADIYQGGGGYLDLGPDILCGGSVGPVVKVRDVGYDATHQEGAGRIPQQGVPLAYRKETLER